MKHLYKDDKDRKNENLASKNDVRIAQFLAGELPPEEENLLCDEAVNNPELAQALEEMSSAWQLLNDSLQADANSAPPALTPERRAAILSTPIPENTPEPIAIGPWLIGAAAAAVIAGMMLPAFNAPREKARRIASWNMDKSVAPASAPAEISFQALEVKEASGSISPDNSRLNSYGRPNSTITRKSVRPARKSNHDTGAETAKSEKGTWRGRRYAAEVSAPAEMPSDAPKNSGKKSFWSRTKETVKDIATAASGPEPGAEALDLDGFTVESWVDIDSASESGVIRREIQLSEVAPPAAVAPMEPAAPIIIKPQKKKKKKPASRDGQFAGRLFKQTGSSIEGITNGIRESEITVTAEAGIRTESEGKERDHDIVLAIGSGGVPSDSVGFKNEDLADKEATENHSNWKNFLYVDGHVKGEKRRTNEDDSKARWSGSGLRSPSEKSDITYRQTAGNPTDDVIVEEIEEIQEEIADEAPAMTSEKLIAGGNVAFLTATAGIDVGGDTGRKNLRTDLLNDIDLARDADGDGLTNAQEDLHGSDPFAADTDVDGISDDIEMEEVLDVINNPSPLRITGMIGGRTSGGRAGAERQKKGKAKAPFVSGSAIIATGTTGDITVGEDKKTAEIDNVTVHAIDGSGILDAAEDINYSYSNKGTTTKKPVIIDTNGNATTLNGALTLDGTGNVNLTAINLGGFAGGEDATPGQSGKPVYRRESFSTEAPKVKSSRSQTRSRTSANASAASAAERGKRLEQIREQFKERLAAQRTAGKPPLASVAPLIPPPPKTKSMPRPPRATAEAPMQTRSYKLSDNVSKLVENNNAQALQSLGIPFPEGSSVQVYEDTGQVHITNTPENLKKTDYAIADAKAPKKDVVIESKFVEYANDKLNSIAIDFEELGEGGAATGTLSLTAGNDANLNGKIPQVGDIPVHGSLFANGEPIITADLGIDAIDAPTLHFQTADQSATEIMFADGYLSNTDVTLQVAGQIATTGSMDSVIGSLNKISGDRLAGEYLLAPPEKSAATAGSNTNRSTIAANLIDYAETENAATGQGLAGKSRLTPEEIAEDESVRRKERELQSEQDFVDAREAYIEGDYETATGKFIAADVKLQEVSRTDPEVKAKRALTSRLLAISYLEWAQKTSKEANQLRKVEQYDDAIDKYQKVIELDPSRRDTVTARIRQLQKDKRKAEFAQDVSPGIVDAEKDERDLDLDKKAARGRVFLENKRYGDAREEYEQILLKDPYNLAATRSLKKINDLLRVHATERRGLMRAERLAETSWKWSDPVTPLVTPTSGGQTKVDSEIELREKLDNIIVPKIDFEDTSLKAVVKYLNQRSQDLDPDQKGVDIVISPELFTQLDIDADRNVSALGDPNDPFAGPAEADDPFAGSAEADDPFAADGTGGGDPFAAHYGGGADPFADPGAGSGDTGAPAAQDIPITMDFDNIPLGEAIRYMANGMGLIYKIENGRVILDKAPVVFAKPSDYVETKEEKKRKAHTVAKMDNIIIPRVSFKDAPITQVVKYLRERSKDLDPDQIGVNMNLAQNLKDAGIDTQKLNISIDMRNASYAEIAQEIATKSGLVLEEDSLGCHLRPKSQSTPINMPSSKSTQFAWQKQADLLYREATERLEAGEHTAAAEKLTAVQALLDVSSTGNRNLDSKEQRAVDSLLNQTYQKLAESAEKENDIDAAISHLQAAIKLNPNRTKALKADIKTLRKKHGQPPHRVVAGDTLWAIAKKYQTTVAKVKAANDLASDLIRPGQLLSIPSATVTVGNYTPDDDGPLPPAPTKPPPPVNPFTLTANDSLSTFALESESASWNLMRRYVNRGYLPPKGTVRMEEFVNYFDYNYTAQPDKTFTVHTAAAESNFGKNLTLLKIGVRGKVLGRDGKKPAHLVFLVDTSGSMGRADRLPLIQQGLSMCLDQLQPTDRVTLISYGSRSRLLLESVPAKNKGRIRAALNEIETGSATNMAEGIRTAYELAARHYRGGQVNRIILCSDGVANVGPAEADDLLETVKRYRQQGISFTSVGVGAGAYDDRMMEQLANQGDGQYVYIDSQAEARRTFVENFSASLNYIARNVKIQVSFDPAVVRRYRLIGYENRNVADKDFRNDKVDAGEIGSGQSATALYEVEFTTPTPQADIGTVFVRHMEVDTETVHEFARPITAELVRERAPKDEPHFHLAACAAEFAEILRGSEYSTHTIADLEQRLIPVANALPLDERVQEFLALVRKAQNLPEYK